MQARSYALALALLALGAAALSAQPAADPWDPQLSGGVRARGLRLVDPQGRQVLLRGVNAGSKQAPFLPPHSAAEVAALGSASGPNLVRLYVAWRAISPRPNAFDAAYLRAVRERAQAWSDAGVQVLIDMHQDVWGGPVTGHGAPDWATLGRGSFDLPASAPWQARYAEPRVWKSFEALWSNQPVGGRGLADRYADAWVALAGELRGVERLVGYDLINEPFLGREVLAALEDLLEASVRPGLVASARAGARSAKRGLIHAFAEGLRGGPLRTLRAAHAGGRAFGAGLKTDLLAELERLARDPRSHHRLLRALGDVNAGFEARLSAFYARVGARIRAVDPDTPIWIEPMALVGVGVPCRMPRPALGNLVYAPHLYDAFVDSGAGFDGELGRVRETLRGHRLAATRLRAPLVIGEWGHLDTLPAGAGRDAYARGVIGELDRYALGAAYWEHRPGAPQRDLDLVLPPYPRRVAGRLLGGGGWDPASQTLTLRFLPAASAAPTVVAAPRRRFPRGASVRASAPIRWRYLPERGLLLIHAEPQDGVLRVEVRPR
ncbi:MAG TPA: hypothetical protein DEA08_39435 [Planctomycetes bacterium]|nr:hypothetical protein [Planctomycetota bacterium]